MIKHPIDPVWDKNSKVLVLGSFPSVKSREQMFFYGHVQIILWRVAAAVRGCDIPLTVDEKRAFLLSNHIAVWDVIASCDITGSSDSSIKNVVPNGANIKAVFTNGKTAHNLYQKYIKDKVGRDDICLPSTSPANAAWTLKLLTESWKQICEYLND